MAATKQHRFSLHHLLKSSKAFAKECTSSKTDVKKDISQSDKDNATVDRKTCDASQESLEKISSISSLTGASCYSCPSLNSREDQQLAADADADAGADAERKHKEEAPPVPKAPSKTLKSRAMTLRKQLQSTRKSPEPVKEEVEPVKEEVEPVKEEVEPVKEESEPVKEEAEPVKEEAVASLKDTFDKTSDTPKQSILKARKDKRRSFVDHRMSTISMASSIAALAPFIAVPTKDDPSDISGFLPSHAESDDDKSEDTATATATKGGSAKTGPKLRSSAVKKAAGRGVNKSRVVKPTTSTPSKLVSLTQEAVSKLSEDLDKQFSTFESDFQESTALDWKVPDAVETTEHLSRLQRLIEWCRRQKQSVLNAGKPSDGQDTKTDRRYHSLPQKTDKPTMPPELRLDTLPNAKLPHLGDPGSPPASLRLQTLPVGIAA